MSNRRPRLRGLSAEPLWTNDLSSHAVAARVAHRVASLRYRLTAAPTACRHAARRDGPALVIWIVGTHLTPRSSVRPGRLGLGRLRLGRLGPGGVGPRRR